MSKSSTRVIFMSPLFPLLQLFIGEAGDSKDKLWPEDLLSQPLNCPRCRSERLRLDSVVNGTVRGMIIGAIPPAIFFGYLGWVFSAESGEQVPGTLGAGAIGAAMGAGAGALIGFLIDRSRHSTELVYLAR